MLKLDVVANKAKRLYEEFKDRVKPSKNTSESIKFNALKHTLSSKVTILVMLSMVVAVIFAGTGPLSSIYLSIVAAGVFYVIFNVYPEQLVKQRAARQCFELLTKLHSNRKWLLSEVMKSEDFSMFDSPDLLSKERCETVQRYINELRGAEYLNLPNGFSLYREQFSISNIQLVSTFSTVADFYIRNRFQGDKKLGLVLNHISLVDQGLVNKLLQVNGIQEFHVFYESLLHLERVLEERIEALDFFGRPTPYICYSLFQAPDKALFYAATELNNYINVSRFANNYKDSGVANWCSDLTQIMVPDDIPSRDATEDEIAESEKFVRIK
ncbi:hypothetical protein DYB89_18110 [Vibrio cholerae]|nr:hypothetical protein [Vibrio cholerae]